MASIKCKACGRRYSYHSSDLCPHCGAYNKPASRMRVDFDKDGNAELLHEKDFLRQSEAGRKREKVCYEQKECHEGAARQVRIPGLDNQQLTEKLKQYGASLRKTEDGELSEGGKALLGVLAFILFLILSVARW